VCQIWVFFATCCILFAVPCRGDEQRIRQRIEALACKSWSDRSRAYTLVDLGAAAVPALIRALDDKRKPVREGGERILRRIGRPAIPALLRALESPKSTPRSRAALLALAAQELTEKELRAFFDCLARTPPIENFARRIKVCLRRPAPSSQPALLDALKSPNQLVRLVALTWLGRLDQLDPNALKAFVRESGLGWATDRFLLQMGAACVPALVFHLRHGKRQRWRAAYRLGDLGSRALAALPALIEALQSPERAVRYAAADALGHIPKPGWTAIPELVRLLSAVDADLRLAAIRSIDRLGGRPVDAIATLIQLLADQHSGLGWGIDSYAASILGRIGRPAIPALSRALESPKPEVQTGALIGLGKIKAPPRKVVDALLRATRHKDEHMRAAAIQVLGLRGKNRTRAIQAALHGLRDKHVSVRSAAVWTLGQFRARGRAAVRGLGAALQDGDAGVRRAAAETLARIGPNARAVIPELLKMLTEKREVEWRDMRGRTARSFAVRALGRIGPSAGKQSVPVLLKLIDKASVGMLSEIAWALGRMGSIAKLGIPALTRILRSNDYASSDDAAEDSLRRIGRFAIDPLIDEARKGTEGSRCLAMGILGRISTPSAKLLALLQENARDRSTTIRLKAARTLAALGLPGQAIAALELLLAHKDRWVRNDALGALGQLGRIATPALPAIIRGGERPAAFESIALIGAPSIEAFEFLRRSLSYEHHFSRNVAALSLVVLVGRTGGQLDLRPEFVRSHLTLNPMSSVANRMSLGDWGPEQPLLEAFAKNLESAGLSRQGAIRSLLPLLYARPRVQARAASLLGLIATPGDRPVQLELQHLLGRAEDQPFIVFREADWRVRLRCAQALVRWGDSRSAVAALGSLLDDEFGGVREDGAHALADIGAAAAAAVPDLVGLLEDDYGPARYAAARAIGKIGVAQAAAPSLLQALKSPDPYLRCEAAIALGRLGHKGRSLEGLQPLLSHADWQLRKRAAQGLADLGPAARKAEDSLVGLLEDEHHWRVRRAVGLALARIGRQDLGLPVLVKQLGHANPGIRLLAIEAFASLGKPGVPALSAALLDKRWWIQIKAARALARAGAGKQALPLLRQLRRHKHPLVRASVTAALAQQTRKRSR